MKRFLIFPLLFALALPAYAQNPVSGMTETTTLPDTSIVYVVLSPFTAGTDRRITGANLKSSVGASYLPLAGGTLSGHLDAASGLTLMISNTDPASDGLIRWDSTEEVVNVGDDGVATHKLIPAAVFSGAATVSATGVVTIAVGDCYTKIDPATDEEFYTLYRAMAATTITEIYAEVTGGTSVDLDFEIDDGTPTGVNGSAITATTSGVADSTLAGDVSMADGDRLDIDFGTVTGSVTQVSFCWEGTIP